VEILKQPIVAASSSPFEKVTDKLPSKGKFPKKRVNVERKNQQGGYSVKWEAINNNYLYIKYIRSKFYTTLIVCL